MLFGLLKILAMTKSDPTKDPEFKSVLGNLFERAAQASFGNEGWEEGKEEKCDASEMIRHRAEQSRSRPVRRRHHPDQVLRRRAVRRQTLGLKDRRHLRRDHRLAAAPCATQVRQDGRSAAYS